VARFQRVVRTVAAQIRIGEQERERAAAEAAARKRRERFAELPSGVSMAALEAIAECESGGDPTAVSASGQYRGKYQFSQATWESLGGTGDPAEADESVQDMYAAGLYQQRGLAPWPACSQQVQAELDPQPTGG
jgi:soluble lytic murein transglycosylase-like protein